MAREPGDKLGARLARLHLAQTIALRTQLKPIEAAIGAAAAQTVIDRAGHEVAALNRPYLLKAIEANPGMDPMLREWLQRAAAGTDQWQALAGQIAMSTATGTIMDAIGNELRPFTYALIASNPHSRFDAQTAATLAAKGIITIPSAENEGNSGGFSTQRVDWLVQGAQAVPDSATIGQLVNRGLIRPQDGRYWIQRGGYGPDLHEPLLELRATILSPADAALAVLRGNMSTDEGYAVAALNGMSRADFDVLIGNTGEPPALEEMLMLHRRHLMDTPTLERAIRQSRVRNEWIPYLLELQVEPPSPADVLEALVQGEISRGEALTRYTAAGGDPSYFETAYRTRANSPAPGQLSEMANRGIIPWQGTGPDATTFAQGFLEGHWKDKWLPAFRDLAVYLPPPREIATLVREGGITQDQALTLWKKHGLSPELAHVYWQAAHYQKTSRVHELAQGEIIKLYTDGEVTRPEALSMLESVNWTKTDAEWLLDIADVQEARRMLTAAITKIRSLYVAYKIDAATARKALHELEVAASAADKYLAIWEIERTSAPKLLTSGEIANAVFYELMPPREGITQLRALGYSELDAWYVLSIRIHGPLPGIPKPG